MLKIHSKPNAASCRVVLALFLLAFTFDTSGARADERGKSVTLAAVGDVLFARGVGKKIDAYGPDYPFELVSDVLNSYDLAFCNLECVLSDRGTPRIKRFLFRADPDRAQILSSAGFDIVSLANNHTLDFGPDALQDTIDGIQNSGMTKRQR